MISHEDLGRLAGKASDILGDREPGLGGRVEPACFALETHAMADTYLRLSATDFGITFGDGATKLAAMDAAERAFRTGMAMGLAHHEEQRRELLIAFARWTLQGSEPKALALIDTLKLGSFESMADHFLEQRDGS